MSDTLTNALSQAQHSSTVLQGIMNPATLNPLTGMGSAISAVQGMQGLADSYAKQRLGEAYQQAVDPATGRLDPLKFNQLVAADPATARAAQSGMESSQALQGAQLKQNIDTQTQINGAVTAALASPDANLKQSVLEQAQRLRALGFPGDRIDGALLHLSSDPAQLRQQLETLRVQSLPPQQQQNVIYGEPFRQTLPGGATGGGVQYPTRPGAPVTGPPGGQPGLPQGLDPGQTAARQQWLQTQRDYPDPANPNVTKHGTNETYLRDTGVPDSLIYPGGAPATPGTQPAASPLGTGRLPPALQNPNKPQATPAPTPTPAPSPAGTGISGPTPEQKAGAAATEETGRLSPPKFQAESDADTLAQNQQAILGNMLVDTSQFTTGPLAGIVGKFRNVAGNLGLNINTDAQSAKESFGKLAAGIAVSQAQAVGAGSDTRFNVVSAANPHEELSPAGVDLILRQLQGNTDYIRARASLAAKYPDKQNYPAFQQSIKDLDPRVFQLSRMTGDQRTTYMNNLDTETRKQVGAAIRRAKDMGVLSGG